MSNETNPFGGKNPNGLYIPMTPDEMEVLERLRDDHGFRIEIKDWGWVDDPVMLFGDKRVSFQFTLAFTAPDFPMPVHSLEMTLLTKTGIHLFGPKVYPTIVEGHPIVVSTGVTIQMALDVAIDEIDTKLVKMIKPGAFGLTTRQGNLHLPSEELQSLLAHMKASEAKIRHMDKLMAIAAMNRKPGSA